MRNKKNVSKLVVLLTGLMMFSTFPVIASNYKDTTYTYYFKTDQNGEDFTERREKQDDTSAYMKCEKTSFPYTAYVVGSNGFFDSPRDLSGGHTYTFDTGTVYKMINYVYENNFKYASIYAKRIYSYNYSASGLWSPDSV